MSQTAYDEELLLSLAKNRLNRLPTDTTLDEMLRVRIKAAQTILRSMGIVLDEQSADDALLTVDYAVWMYQSRDMQTGRPDWLGMRLRQRWLTQKREVSP